MCLISLTMIISRSMHVDSNGFIVVAVHILVSFEPYIEIFIYGYFPRYIIKRCVVNHSWYSTSIWVCIRILYAYVSQFTSVAKLCPTLCDPMDCCMPGFPVHHVLPEPAQTQVHRVGDATQPVHPLSSASPPAFNPSQYQGLFQWVSSSYQVAKELKF